MRLAWKLMRRLVLAFHSGSQAWQQGASQPEPLCQSHRTQPFVYLQYACNSEAKHDGLNLTAQHLGDRSWGIWSLRPTWAMQ